MVTLKKIVFKIRDTIIIFLDVIVPKNPELVIVGSNSRRAITGNAKSILLSLKAFDHVNTRYCSQKSEDYLSMYKRIDGFTFRDFWFFLRTKNILTTHGASDIDWVFSSRKKHVESWHGIPFKAMGIKDKKINKKSHKSVIKKYSRVSKFISSSYFVGNLYKDCFMLSDEQISNIGFPRVENMLNSNKESLKEKYQCNNIFLYAPTFRDDGFTRIFPFDDFNEKELENFLISTKTIIFLRLHPNDSNLGVSNIKNVKSFDSIEYPDINDYLNQFDGVITDYSSIYFDFITTQRPSILIPYDLENYMETRGMLFKSYSEAFVDNKVDCFFDFISSLARVINKKDEYFVVREELVSKLYGSSINGATERVLKELGK